MDKSYTYLLVNFFTIIIPFLFSFHPKILFYKYWKFLIPGLVITALFFILWDILFTHCGIWYFNKALITGLMVGNLPLEEILFFITVPYSCMFVYFIFRKLISSEQPKFFTYGLYALTFILLVISLIFKDEAYTFSSFFLLSVYSTILLSFKVDYLKQSFISYAILLLPFFLVNGFLTGMFSEPVVLYNNNENLGIRFVTIPVEDTFYGLLLFLMNVSLFELFNKILNHR